jgi:hypothetical protein
VESFGDVGGTDLEATGEVRNGSRNAKGPVPWLAVRESREVALLSRARAGPSRLAEAAELRLGHAGVEKAGSTKALCLNSAGRRYALRHHGRGLS